MFSLSIFRLARGCSLSIGGGSRAARAIYFLWNRRRRPLIGGWPPSGASNSVCALGGAGAFVFMDRRWPSDAVAAAGRPRPRAATLGHAAVRARELGRVNHFREPHARARRVPSPQRVFIFAFPQRAGAGPAWPTIGPAAASELRRHRRWPPVPPIRREGAPACSRSRFSGWRGGALYPLAVAAERRGRFIFYGIGGAGRGV